MANVDITRSIQFVSLDTHPANNALVVTYEIQVSVSDRASQRELARRNKRDQLQVSISALDSLKEEDLKAEKLVINLQELSTEIVRKCPLLLSERHNLEDIQLHLLYLISRRKSQLLAQQLTSAEDGVGGSQQHLNSSSGGGISSRERPPSSASMHLRSAQQQQANSRTRGYSASARQRKGSLHRSGTGGGDTDLTSSVYSYLHAKESSAKGGPADDALEIYMDQFDEHLNTIDEMSRSSTLVTENLSELSRGNGEINELIDAHLEGLYGDNNERSISVVFIRRLSKNDESLLRISSNRLLVCALLRTLRDSDTKDRHLRESIFYCLIRFTTFEDLYTRVFIEGGEPIDLTKIILDLLVDHVKILGVGRGQTTVANEQLKLLMDKYYYTNSLLIILMNLLELDGSTILMATSGQQQQQQQQLNILQRILSQQQPIVGKRLVSSLIDLLQLATKHLARDIRLSSHKPEKMTNLLSRVICILRHLSIFKEFISQIRGCQVSFVESAINLVNTLQLSRPGSGAPPTELSLVSDKQTLNELYELEVNVFRLLNNIIFDHKLKLKLIKKNLLKCVLRNIVVFLASRKSQTLSPFNRSPVLMVPFKSLYELTCDDYVKFELYKSKIIMKCLLEYLLSTTMDLKPALDLLAQQKQQQQQQVYEEDGRKSAADMMTMDPFDDQIVVEPISASHYIVSLWVNLSAKREATIYSDDLELRELVFEYMELCINNLKTFLSICRSSSYSGRSASLCRLRDDHLMIYLHMKLLRNLSQFLEFNSSIAEPPLLMIDLYTKWSQRIGEATNDLIALSAPSSSSSSRHQILLARPISVECLAILSNLLSKSESLLLHDELLHQQQQVLLHAAPPMACLFAGLFLVLSSAGDFDSENDDLLLVSVIFLGTLARNREICDDLLIHHRTTTTTTTTITSKIINASNFILHSKTTDHELIISSLYTLSQLMNHSGFLKEILSGEFLDEPIEKLVDKLANLMLHGDLMVEKLAILLLNRFRQLEEQRSIDSDMIYKKRFASYNGKWLATIRASREDLTSDGGQQPPVMGYPGDYDDDDDDDLLANESANENYYRDRNRGDEDNDDGSKIDGGGGSGSGSSSRQLIAGDFSHLRAFDSDEFTSSAAAGGGFSRLAPNPDLNLDLDQDLDEADADEGEEISDAPDLNVIDANSMIKHLTSRREFRSEWLRRKDSFERRRANE